MIGAIIQARMASARLPGKVMKLLGSKPMLQWVIEGVLKSKVEKIVVLVTKNPADNAIMEMCLDMGVEWVVRDEENDVLGGFYKTATLYGMDPIMRVTGDCPLICSSIIDSVIDEYLKGCDYCATGSNVGLRTFPRGVEADMMSYAVLNWMHENLTPERTPYGRYHSDYREHITLYLREHPGLFTTRNVSLGLNRLRMTVDTEDEYQKMDELFRRMGDTPSWLRVVELMELHPELAMIETPDSQTKAKWRVW